MTGMLRVLKLNNTFINETSTTIRAIVNGQTRGIVKAADIIFVGDDAYLPITIYNVKGNSINKHKI